MVASCPARRCSIIVRTRSARRLDGAGQGDPERVEDGPARRDHRRGREPVERLARHVRGELLDDRRSLVFVPLMCVLLAVTRDFLVGREPDAVHPLHVLDQRLEHPHARAVAGDVRMHRELEQSALGDTRHRTRALKISSTAAAAVYGRSAGAAVHAEVRRIVAESTPPGSRRCRSAGRPPCNFVRLVVGHQRRVVEQPELADDAQRARAEVPRRRAHAHRRHTGDLFERSVARNASSRSSCCGSCWLRSWIQPCMPISWPSSITAALLVGMQQGDTAGTKNSQARCVLVEKLRMRGTPTREPYSPCESLPGLSSRVAQRDRLVVGVEGQRHAHPGPALPARRAQRPAGADLLDAGAPPAFFPGPGRVAVGLLWAHGTYG